MTAKERREHAKLRRLWAAQRATQAQILRCMELDRKAALFDKPTNATERIRARLKASGLY